MPCGKGSVLPMDREATGSSGMYEAVLQRYECADHWASLEPPTLEARW